MLQKTEILNIIIGVALMTGSYAIWKDTRICLSIALGSAIGGANFWALYNIIKGLVGDAGGKIKFAFFAFFKFFILIFVLWASIKWLPLNAVAFLVGLSTVVVAMSLASLRGASATKQSP